MYYVIDPRVTKAESVYSRAHSSGVMFALGLARGAHLPPEGMPTRMLRGTKSVDKVRTPIDIKVWVTPATDKGLTPQGRKAKSSTHRVMCACPGCNATVPVGRLFQHKCKPAKPASLVCASIGSISEGTTRTADLLDDFAAELEHLCARNADAWCSDAGRAQRDRYLALVGEARECIEDHGAEIVAELTEALQDFAPRYATFGAHPGDGADFGFWLNADEVRERIKEDGGLVVSDTSEVSKRFRGEVLHVNDHGNATLYDSTAKGLVEVWAVV